MKLNETEKEQLKQIKENINLIIKSNSRNGFINYYAARRFIFICFYKVAHIFSYNSGFNDVANICITVATSIIACPTIIGSGFFFL